ncbi:MAG: pilus assembly protein PilZ [Gammaproteobacteria bacterium]|jgi:type IV pilus assembly protein PilZ|nr:MAG: pilus assembly protein PilZ [Gammaproteobacteria bacterium]
MTDKTGVAASGLGRNMMQVNIRNKSVLYASYMPFLKNGGLFISTPKYEKYKLGDEVFLVINLFDEEKLPVAGKVVWITPRGSGRAAGVGIQFGEIDKGKTRSRIETHLAGTLNSDRPTHTM